MTPEEVRVRVAHINAIRRDDEAAHAEEDSLHMDVLKAISDGTPNAEQLADEALKTQEIDFARWCA